MAGRGRYPRTPKRATGFRASTSRRTCGTPPATSHRPRVSQSAAAPISTICSHATACIPRTSRMRDLRIGRARSRMKTSANEGSYGRRCDPGNAVAVQGVQGVRGGRRRITQGAVRRDPRADRSERRRQDDVLQFAHQVLATDVGGDLLPRREHHPGEACGYRPPRHRPFLPDMRGIPASYGFGERARGSAARPVDVISFLALGKKPVQPRWRSHAAVYRSAAREMGGHPRGRTAVRQKACPGTGHYPGARARVDAARRAHAGHGARGRVACHAADQAAVGRPHRAHGGTQHERGLLHRRYHIRAAARQGNRRRALCRSVEEPAGSRSLHGDAGTYARGLELMAREMLKISALEAWYGESHILHGVDLTVQEGEVVTLLGRNGAGRTTTLRAILGLVGSRTGSVKIDGMETVRLPTHRIARIGVGYCPEERGIFSALSAEENLLLPPRLKGAQAMSLEEIYHMFPNLRERAASPGTRLSGGEQQMLAVARILRTGARLLLLDEISEGLAPVIVQKLGEVIRALRANGFTVVLVEQNFHFAAPLADRFYVMEHGRIVKQFAQSELASQTGLLQEFLGV